MAEFYPTDGDDSLLGTAGNDYFWLSQGNDTLDGGDGADALFSYDPSSAVIVDLGAGTALFRGFAQVLRNIEHVETDGHGSRLTGSEGDNELSTLGRAATVDGGGGDDTITAEETGAMLSGGAGNDRIAVSPYAGSATVSGGTGDDLFETFLWSTDIDVTPIAGGLRIAGRLNPTSPRGTRDVMDDVEWLEFNDATLTWAQLQAMAPNLITGTAGDDILYGAAGDDLIEALAGDDWILPGGMGRDTVDGGDGWDMLSLAGFAQGISVDTGAGTIRAGRATIAEFSGIEGITGTSQLDVFYGSAGNDYFRGIGGRDQFFGRGGADYFNGGDGIDRVGYQSDPGQPGVHVSLLRGRGWAGEAAGDRLTGIENLSGGMGDDTLTGDHGDNLLGGSHGDDLLTGLGGDDYLHGSFGTDVARYFGNRADYDVVTNGFRTEVIHLNDGWEGHDVLAHVEILRFADGDLIL